MNNRIEHIDAVAGLMILWMVFGHLQQVCGVQLQYPNLLFFFMPWFYYKSGMLFENTFEPLHTQASKRFHKLFRPFIIYAIVGQLALTTCFLVEGVDSLKPYLYSPLRSLVLGGCIPGNTPLWFLPSLFVTQCVSIFLLTQKNSPWLWALVSIVLGFGISFIDSRFIPTYIKSTFGGVFFFCMGNWLKDWQYKWWMTIVMVLSVIIVILCHISGFDIRENSVDGYYFLGAVVSLVGCIAINGLTKWIQLILKLRILQYIGRNAMLIYVTHWIVLLLSVRLVASDILCINNTKWLLLIGGLSCLITIPIYIKVLKYVKSKQNPN